MQNNETMPLSFSANDWFYMKPDCKTTYDTATCESNETAVNHLRSLTNDFGASITQYNDSKMLYNRELLFTFNILVGLGMLCYYIYVNQSALPSSSDLGSGMSSIGKSMNGVTSAIKSNIAITK